MEKKRIQFSLIIVSTIIFIIVFILLFPKFGGVSGILGVVPIIMAGWFFSWQISLIVGLSITILNGVLYFSSGETDFSSIILGGITASAFGIILSRVRLAAVKEKEKAEVHSLDKIELERQTEELYTLVEVSKSLSVSLDLDDILNLIAQKLTHAIDASGCTLSYWDEAKDRVVTWVEFRSDIKDFGDVPGLTYALTEFPLTREVLENQKTETINIADISADSAEREHMEKGGTSSLLMVPIVTKDKVIGLVELDDHRIREFTRDEIDLCEKLTEQASTAIENANLFKELQSRLEEQMLLKKAVSTIASSLDLDEILGKLCEYLCQLLDVTSVCVSVFNPENRTSMVIADFISDNASELEKVSDVGVRYEEDDEKFLTFIESGIPTVDTISDPELGEFEQQHMIAFGSKTVLYIPLRMKGKTQGYIEIWESRYERKFSNLEIANSETIADQAAIAIENTQLFEQAQKEIAERKRAEKEARQAESMLRSLAENSSDHILLLDEDLKIRYLNYPSPGLSIEELIGTPLYTLVEEDQQHYVREILERVLETGNPESYETSFITPDNEKIYYESWATARRKNGDKTGLVLNSRDISARKAMEKQLEFFATHDALTNLSNRRVFEDQLRNTLNLAKRQTIRVDVAIIDLDNFKEINDAHGHLVGDQVLVEVAARLESSVRETDTVARLGGDEFIVLFVNPEDTRDIEGLIGRLISSISVPIKLDVGEVIVTGSLGLSTCISGEIDPASLLKQADIAMYQAKNQIEPRYRFFEAAN